MLSALHRPRRLQAGDVVRIIAPSGPVDPDSLAAGTAILADWGLTVEVGEHVLDRSSPYLAGNDAARIADLARAWCDPRVAAVLCARGGYGLHRVTDWVDWPTLRAARSGIEAPVLVGCSDATALHEAVATRLGVVSVHGPMPGSKRFLSHEPSQEHLRSLLFGNEREDGPITGSAVHTLMPGRAHGVLCGGNLATLAAGVGTYTAQRSLAGGIVVLEDVAESPYRIDRMLTQILRAGVFDGVAGVAGGTWVGCGDPEEVNDILSERLGHLGVPIVNGLEIGHGFGNRAFPLGVTGVLDADQGILWWQAPALR